MYTRDDRILDNDRYVAIITRLQKLDRTEEYRNEIIKLGLQLAELQTKVNLYEKYISYCIDHDSIELGEVCSFDGELYRMVSRKDEHNTGCPKTICCEFHCTTPITKNFKK